MLLALEIMEDMKKFMHDKNTIALEAIRMLRSDIKNIEIEKKHELDDADIIKIVQSTIKKNKEAAEIFIKGNRADLAEKENRYIEVLNKYMPAQLDKDAIKKVIADIVAEMKDIDPKTGFGAVMKAAKEKMGSSADGKVVSALVKEVLDGNH